MKNQHGLNEGKHLIGKKIISQLSASDVTRVVSLDTNNKAKHFIYVQYGCENQSKVVYCLGSTSTGSVPGRNRSPENIQ